jgi:nucleoside-diphosphate-sugar epimerase
MLSANHKDSSSILLFKRLVTGKWTGYVSFCSLALRHKRTVFCRTHAGEQPPVKYGWGVVDVRDVAKAHVAAIENLNAKGRSVQATGLTAQIY